MAHHQQPIATFYQEWWAAACGLVALTWLLRDEGEAGQRLPVAVLLPVGLLALCLLQFLLLPGVVPERLALFALGMAWAALLVILGYRLAATMGREALADLLAAALLAGSLAAAATALLQASHLIGLPYIFPHPGGGLRGNVGQPNNLADYLWLGTVSAIYLTHRRRLGRLPAFLALAALIAVSALTGSRSVWAFALALLALATWWRRTAPTEGRQLLTWVGVAAASLVAAQVLFTVTDVFSALQVASGGERLAAGGTFDPMRGFMWRVAWSIFLDHPWLGAGVGQYPHEFHLRVADQPPSVLVGVPEHAHNLILDLLADLGLGSALLLLVTGGTWACSLLRRPADAGNWWIAGVATVLAVHSGLEYPLWYAFFLGPAALVLGAGSNASFTAPGVFQRPAVLLALLLLGAGNLASLRSDYDALEGSLDPVAARHGPARAGESLVSTLARLERDSLLAPYANLAAASFLMPNAKLAEVQLAVVERAVHFSPARQIVFKHAHLLAMAGRQEEARLALERASLEYPDLTEPMRAAWRRQSAGDPALAALLTAFSAPSRP